MTDTPLRDLLTDLTRDPSVQAEFQADPGGWLASHGHDLSDDLVAEAVVSVSAVLPVEVAEHLAPFTIGASPIPAIEVDPTEVDDPGATLDGLDGLALLGSSPQLDEADGAPEQAAIATGDDHFGSGADDGSSAVATDVAAEAGVDPLDPLAETTSAAEAADTVDAGPLDPLASADPADHDSDVDLDLDGELDPTLGDDPADLDGID